MKIIIMAGGKGRRFWPLSNRKVPKQFIKIYSENSMLQETFNRYKSKIPLDKIFVITTKEYKDLVLEQLPELSDNNILLEPEQRDTGPCIALAAMHFLKKNDNEVLVVTPSDQCIKDNDNLIDKLFEAEKLALIENKIITLGVVPTRPETGYGYMQIEALHVNAVANERKVSKFIEKPSLEQAEQLIKNHNTFWNSGIYVWKPSTIEYNMQKYQPELWTSLLSNWDQLDKIYPNIKKISVDYAITEKAEEVFMLPININWDDFGTWNSLERIFEIDENANILLGDVEAHSTEDCTLLSKDTKLVVIGAKDLIIASTKSGVLICHKSKEKFLKSIIKEFE
ncbi:mannose-1-phosphate guanylyltransferase [Niallia nealsonii]|uniref:Mannose-1-phosphate guanylyltransferase n=1 Tax=Niallia nealsonii TaxID=115979 RepID=A0A2N0YZS1_9BACI|nr:sugar phosphate nucleotidyltransferase [Niallia nealsonii]PKG22761.1 mannose-1-phosphate guanylyltransferase [Niallia nealsonii]